jgi:hypothetical protein
MSHERFHRFTCDNCGKSVEKIDYGLPKGFIYLNPDFSVGRKTIEHRCEDCQDLIELSKSNGKQTLEEFLK